MTAHTVVPASEPVFGKGTTEVELEDSSGYKDSVYLI